MVRRLYAKIIQIVRRRAAVEALRMGGMDAWNWGAGICVLCGLCGFRWSGHREDVDVHHPCGGAEAGCRLRGIITPNLFSVTGL